MNWYWDLFREKLRVPIFLLIKESVVKAQHKDDYIAAVNALDRVLRHEYYLIPHWYSPYQRVAYWDRFAHKPSKEPIGLQIFTWWEKTSEGKK